MRMSRRKLSSQASARGSHVHPGSSRSRRPRSAPRVPLSCSTRRNTTHVPSQWPSTVYEEGTRACPLPSTNRSNTPKENSQDGAVCPTRRTSKAREIETDPYRHVEVNLIGEPRSLARPSCRLSSSSCSPRSSSSDRSALITSHRLDINNETPHTACR